MRVLDLFSGIGGFSLGLERAGMETVAFCEIEPFCQKVLKKHWPDVPCYSDITKLTAEQLENEGITGISVLTGGYPCQPFSQVGKRQGAEDDRHLWPEMYRLIKTIKPRWVVAENVAGHISMGLDQVLSDLEAISYSWWTFVIPACAKDAPHRRDRVWIVADSNGELCRDKRKTKVQGYRGMDKRKTVITDYGKQEPLAHTNQQGLEGSAARGKIQGRQTATGYGGQGSASPGRTWSVEPSVGRVADGVPDRVDRLKSLGNAVVPQVVEQIGRAIMNTTGR